MTLNIAIILGFALTLLKGGELILRPYQRKAVQTFLEDVTIRLDELDFNAIAQRMATPEAQFCFIVLAYLEFTFIGVVVIILQGPEWQPGGQLYEIFGSEGRYFQVAAVGLGLLTLALGWKWPIPILMQRIIGTAKSRLVVFLRFVVFVTLSFIFFGAYEAALFGVAIELSGIDLFGIDPFELSSHALLPLYIGLIIIWPVFVIFWVLMQAIGMLLQARMFYVRWTFMLIRGLMWRIVEYDKGATAAIILIVTILLTLLKDVAG